MADNTLTALIPTILGRAVKVLREQATLIRSVNLDYSREAAQHGATIDVPLPTAVATSAVAPSNTPPATTALTPSTAQIQLNNWQMAAFKLSDKDLQEIKARDHFLPQTAEEAVRALVYDINASIHAKYTKVYGFHSDAAFTATHVDPFVSTVAAATGARKVLHSQMCPRSDRRMVLDFDAEANALNLSAFSDFEKTGDSAVKIEGILGRKYGFDWMTDDQITTHTAGTASADTDTIAVDFGAGYAIGTETVVLDVDAGTSTLVVGDILKFNGHAQTYTVTSGGTLDTTGISVGISPPLKAAVVDGETVTVTKGHTVNLAFHRDAFALAVRPLRDGLADFSFGSPVASATTTDPVSGLPLRLTVSYEFYQIVWRFDILWGVELVRPELATRVAGAL